MAFLLGLLAFALNLVFLESKSTEGQQIILASKKLIRYGEPVQRSDLFDVTVQGTQAISGNYIRSQNFSAKKGTVAQSEIQPGEILTEAALGERALDFDLRTLGPDERLIAINVDEVSSVGYRIHIGDRIDIYSHTLGENTGPLLTAVEVVAVGSEARSRSTSGTSYTTIGLKLSRQEAEQVLYAQSTSGNRFRITLRSPDSRR